MTNITPKLPPLPLDLDNTHPRISMHVKAGELVTQLHRWGREVYLAGQSQATRAVPEGLSFDGYHDSDEHYGKTILDLVRSRLEVDPDDLAEGDVFYVSATWVQPQEWRVVYRNGGTVEVERVSPPAAAPTAQEVTQQAAPTESQERDYKWLLGLAKSKGYTTVYAALYAAPTTQQAAPDETAEQAMAEIGKLIDTQDNRATDAPIFVVEQKTPVISDADYNDCRVEWRETENGDYVLATEERAARLEALFQAGRETPSWRRYEVTDVWTFVTACFTEQGCKDYLARNGHNLRETRIYAYGSYRNEEFRAIRNWLKDLAPTTSTVSAPPEQAYDLGEDRIDNALANFLAEHTNLSQDGIDTHAITMAWAINHAALKPVDESDIQEWCEQGYLTAPSSTVSAPEEVRDAAILRQIVGLGVQLHFEGRRHSDDEAVWADDVMLWTEGDRMGATRKAVEQAALKRTTSGKGEAE